MQIYKCSYDGSSGAILEYSEYNRVGFLAVAYTTSQYFT